MKEWKLGDKVPGSLKFWAEYNVQEVGVYTGLKSSLKKVNVKWTEDKDCPTEDRWFYITLDDIREQLKNARLITVIEDGALRGYIYTYGNHGDFWECTGLLWGYA